MFRWSYCRSRSRAVAKVKIHIIVIFIGILVVIIAIAIFYSAMGLFIIYGLRLWQLVYYGLRYRSCDSSWCRGRSRGGSRFRSRCGRGRS